MVLVVASMAACSSCHRQSPVDPGMERASEPDRATAPTGDEPASQSAPAVAEAELPADDPDPRFAPRRTRLVPGTVLAEARNAFDNGEGAVARALAEPILLAGALPRDELDLLRWIAARGAQSMEDIETAIRWWSEIDDEGPLGRWARLTRARPLLDLDPAATRVVLAPLLEPEWPGQREAQILDAFASAKTAEPEVAIPLLRHAATRGPMRNELELALAKLLSASEDSEQRIEAVEVLRGLEVRSPVSRIGREAAARLEALLETFPSRERRRLSTATPAQRLARAEALERARELEEAEDAFATLARELRGRGRIRCEARLGRGRVMYRRRREREAAAPMLGIVARECREPDTRAAAYWYSAKSYSGSSQPRQALAQYEVLAAELPDHRLADDALILAGRIAAELGDPEAARQRMTDAIARDGDMADEARFRNAWNTFRGGDYEAALAAFDAGLEAEIDEHAEDIRGRSQYWRARTLVLLERPEEAKTQYRWIVSSFPLSYYAQQSLLRLGELGENADALLPPHPDSVVPLRFDLTELGIDESDLEVPIALFRVGESSAALDELELLQRRSDDADDPRWLWLMASLADAGRAYTRSVELIRRRARTEVMDHPPRDEHFTRWRLAYPKAFEPLLDDIAEREEVPSAFVRAVAREESSFNARAISPASAFGLMQVIRPTARRVGRPLGLPTDPDSLRTAAINARIGAHYIAGLRHRYESNVALVPAAYNAGEGAVDRWLHDDGDRPLDIFVDEIPYEETQRYTRRVLQSWGIYAWLYERTLPDWPVRIPARN